MLATADSAPFYPPYVKPPAKPLRFPFNLIKLLNNSLEVIPEQAYREPLVVAPGPPRMAFFTGADLVKTLLEHPTQFPRGAAQIEVLKPIAGRALHAVEGREWRWQRGAMAPLFRHEELLRHGPIISAAAEAAVAKWRAASPGAIHFVDKDMTRAVLHVMSRTMVAGVPADVLDLIERGHTDYYNGVNWWLLYTLLRLPHWLPRPGGTSMRAIVSRSRKAVYELVHKRRTDAASGDDLLARMLRASDPESGQSMSDELLVDNILAFLVGGTDTTAMALTWTLYLISQSPEWEGRILGEIEQVVGSGPVTTAHVERLGIVQQVVHESLRLFPTAPMLVRDINENIELAGIKIPAGTIGVIPIYAIHRHRSYWDDPYRFDPNRFAPRTGAKPTRYQFMPFGAGPRICIGAAFSMLEVTIMIATFVRAARFEVSPDFHPQPWGQVFLQPRNGMPMRVTLRDKPL
jgi:cytochrome P450